MEFVKDSSEVVASVAAPAMTFFQTPVKAINSQEDLKKFESSTSYRELMQFIQLSSEAIVGFEMPAISATITSSSSATFPSPSPSSSSCCNTAITEITSFLSKIASWVDEIPPIQQPMRFGNKAFRDWHARLVQEAPFFLAQYLQEHTPDRNSQATCELEYYLCTSFGNETRIDYGTGHETNFLVFLFCLAKLDVLKGGDLKDMITHIFRGYIQVMRKLQQIYMLEPAGSHGVWGLDDYHCLVFVFGAAQLMTRHEMSPVDVCNPQLLQERKDSWIYFEGIHFIRELKSSAPFAESSPILYDISGQANWEKVYKGLLRMYEGEVLKKLVVVQHLYFGSILKKSW